MNERESELRDVEFFAGEFGRGAAMRHKPEYRLGQDAMDVYDPVWGKEQIDEPVLLELAGTDALRRLQTVEQLTLPDRYKTIPESTYFSRWEHVWGTTIFARRIAKQLNYSEHDATKLQLRALLSDVCHTAHSHAGDWIFQGIGKAETFHDDRRQNFAEATGISDILRRHGFKPAEILEEKKDGIIDAKMPELDVDRVDYTLREAYRWVDQIPEYRGILNQDSFVIQDGRIVAANKQVAKLMGVTYALLVAEHWQEPAHRLQLDLFLESIRRVFVARQGQENTFGSYSPVDLMMTTDDVLATVSGEPDEYMHMLDDLMRGVSSFEVEHRWHPRAERIREALTTSIEGRNGSSIEWLMARYDELPRAYEIEPADESSIRNSSRVKTINLKQLRKRYINPPYIDEHGEVTTLQESDPAFAEYLDTVMSAILRDWRAGIVGNRAATTALRNCIDTNNDQWSKIMDRPHMPNSLLREYIRQTVINSNVAASSFIDFRVK